MTDLYVTNWLLQNSEGPNQNITWRQNDNGLYFTDVNKGKNCVHIEIIAVLRPPRTIIKLSSIGLDKIEIQEPLSLLFRKKYGSEEDEVLAKTMKCLLVVVSSQYIQRQKKTVNEDERKQTIYQRLLSGGSID